MQKKRRRELIRLSEKTLRDAVEGSDCWKNEATRGKNLMTDFINEEFSFFGKYTYLLSGLWLN